MRVPHNFKDLTNLVIGEWTVLERLENRVRSNGTFETMWKCKCSCGVLQSLSQGSLFKNTPGFHPKCRACHAKNMCTGTLAMNQVLWHYKMACKKRNRIWGLTDTQFLEISQKPCHYCGSLPFKEHKEKYDAFVYNGIDRKDNSVGYILENCLPCCSACNYAKRQMSYDDFIAWLEKISENRSALVPEYGMSAC